VEPAHCVARCQVLQLADKLHAPRLPRVEQETKYGATSRALDLVRVGHSRLAKTPRLCRRGRSPAQASRHTLDCVPGFDAANAPRRHFAPVPTVYSRRRRPQSSHRAVRAISGSFSRTWPTAAALSIATISSGWCPAGRLARRASSASATADLRVLNSTIRSLAATTTGCVGLSCSSKRECLKTFDKSCSRRLESPS
jgi:hypothetical protein